MYLCKIGAFSVDLGEVKTAPTECKEKCFKVKSSAYLHCRKTCTLKYADVDDSSKRSVRILYCILNHTDTNCSEATKYAVKITAEEKTVLWLKREK